MLLGIALVFIIFSLLKRYAWNKRNLYHKFALAAGALGFFIILTPLQELDKSRLDNTQGMLLVGIGSTLMLFLLRKKLNSSIASLEKKDRYCPDCGGGVPNNAKFCPNCGIKLASCPFSCSATKEISTVFLREEDQVMQSLRIRL